MREFPIYREYIAPKLCIPPYANQTDTSENRLGDDTENC